MQAFIGATLLASKDAQPKRKPLRSTTADSPASHCEYSRAACDRTTRALDGAVELRWARPTLSCLRKRGRNVGGCWETWHMAATRYTALAGLTV
jgi:hypothetical protein